MFVALSRLTIILIVAGIVVIAVILGVTLGILLHPCRIATVPTDLAITNDNDGLVRLSWLNSEENGDCSVSYKITYILNSGEEVEVKTSKPRCTINPKVLCFDLLVNVWAIGRFGRQSDEYATNYYNVLLPPRHLMVLIDKTENKMIFTWQRDELQFQCDLEYKVIYWLLDGKESVYRTREPTISFDIAYCNTARVAFYTIGQNVESLGYSNMGIGEGLPTTVEPVRNIRINSISKNVVRVLWDSPRFVESCTDIVYAVTATNENKGVTSTCTGKSECEIILEDLCPVTNFTVESSSIIGEETWKIYECSNVDSH